MTEHGTSDAAERPAWRDARVLDRRVSLGLLAGVVVLYVTTSLGGLPRGTGVRGAVAWVALVVLAKLVVMALGIAQRWTVWPALLAEAVSLATIGGIVATQTEQKAWVIVAGVLFAGAVFWRRRAGTDEDDAEGGDEDEGDAGEGT